MRSCSCSQQTVMLAVDRQFPDLSYRELLTGVLVHEIDRTAIDGETVH